MKYLKEHSLSDQSPKIQFSLLESFEEGDSIDVVVKERGNISGKVNSVTKNESEDGVDEVYVNFLQYESKFRDDDSPNHTVSISRLEDGSHDRAELFYPVNDSGKVRRKTVGDVSWVWPGLTDLIQSTVLSQDEAKLVLLKQMGLSEEEIADQWGSDERTIGFALSEVQDTYYRSKQTLKRLESFPIEPKSSRIQQQVNIR